MHCVYGFVWGAHCVPKQVNEQCTWFTTCHDFTEHEREYWKQVMSSERIRKASSISTLKWLCRCWTFIYFPWIRCLEWSLHPMLIQSPVSRSLKRVLYGDAISDRIWNSLHLDESAAQQPQFGIFIATHIYVLSGMTWSAFVKFSRFHVFPLLRT